MAARPKRKQKTKPKLTDKAQSERFKQTDRELGIRENEGFEQIVARLARQKPSRE
jgi:hypothetical protein